jgi:hypothetical protein
VRVTNVASRRKKRPTRARDARGSSLSVAAWKQVADLDLRRQRTILDPTSLPQILKRIFSLADRAVKVNEDASIAPGLDAIAWLAEELRGAIGKGGLDSSRLERHRAAHRAATGTAGQAEATPELLARLEAAAEECATLDDSAEGRRMFASRLSMMVPGRTVSAETVASLLKSHAQKRSGGRGSAGPAQRKALLGVLVELSLAAPSSGDAIKKSLQRGRATLKGRGIK